VELHYKDKSRSKTDFGIGKSVLGAGKGHK
jgi:hypothetical protein